MAIRLYNELAQWWPILSPPEEYEDEASFFRQVFAEPGLPPAPTLLELGCGGGSNALYLKADFARVTLTDLSPEMLALSQDLNPDCEHVLGDMRTLRLDRTFDAIFIHDAIDYMTTLHDLRLAMETAFAHCRPGGLALVVPDHMRETFQEGTEHGGGDSQAGNGRALRYLQWTYDPNPSDTTYTVEYAYLLREGSGPAHIEHDVDTCGLFSRDDWLRLFREVGFEPEIVQDSYEREVFIARRPA